MNARCSFSAAFSAALVSEIDTLNDEVKKLNDARAEAEQQRKEEKAENANTISEAKAGLAAVKMAIDILDKFYKTSAKAKVDLSLAQAEGPLDDAPGAGFEIGEAYKGAGAESGGIIGMMEVIKSDFERTISETEKAEAQAKKDHMDFLTETKMSLAKKKMAKEQNVKLRDETAE